MSQEQSVPDSDAPMTRQEKRAAMKAAFAKRWGKRAGIFLFLFFLIKGLLWLIVPAAIYYFGWGDGGQ